MGSSRLTCAGAICRRRAAMCQFPRRAGVGLAGVERGPRGTNVAVERLCTLGQEAAHA